MIRIFLTFILLAGVHGQGVCKKLGICCSTSFAQCSPELTPACTGFFGQCSMDPTVPPTSCSGSATAKTLTQTSYSLPVSSGVTNTGLNFATAFENYEGHECSPYLCGLYSADSMSAICGRGATADAPLSHSFLEEGSLVVDTTQPLSSYYCISCITLGSNSNTNIVTSEIFQVEIVGPVCTTSSVISLSPAIADTSFTFEIRLGVIPSTSEFPVFSDTGGDECSIASMALVISPSDSGSHPYLEFDTSSRKVVLKDAAKKHQVATIQFAIQYTFENGIQKYVQDSSGNQLLTLVIICDSASTTIQAGSYPTISTTTFSMMQYSPTGVNGKYYLPQMTSSLVDADPTASCSISSWATDSPDLTAVTDSTLGYHYVEAADDTAARLFAFALTVQAVGGAAQSTAHIFHFGCHTASPLVDPNSPSPITRDVQLTPGEVVLEQLLPFTSSNPNCAPVTYQVYLRGSPMPSFDFRIACSGRSPCDVYTTLSTTPRTLNYKIKAVFPDSMFLFTDMFTVTFQCSAAAQVINQDYPLVWEPSFIQFDTSNRVHFGPYECAIASCCGRFTNAVHNSDGRVSYVLGTNSSFWFEFDSSQVGTTVYTIASSDAFGHRLEWEARITILDFCSSQSTFVLSFDPPRGSEMARISGVGGQVRLSQAPPVTICLKLDVEERTSFSIDVSERFSSSRCPADDYRVTTVLFADQADDLRILDAFSIDAEGVLRYEHSVSVPINRMYSVEIEVFNGFLWSQIGLSLLEVEICQFCSGRHSLPATAPYFIEPLPERVEVNATAGGSFRLELPEIFEPNGDACEVILGGESSEVSYSAEENTLELNLADLNTSSNLTLEIELRDVTGLSSTYNLPFEVIVEDKEQLEVPGVSVSKPDEGGEEIKGSEGYLSPSEKPDLSQEEITAEITDISNLGKVTIEFSEPPLSIPNLVPENLEVYVVPASQRHLEEGFRLPSVNLTWNLQRDLNRKEIQLQVIFNEPLAISPLAEQDTLVVHFTKELRPLLATPGKNMLAKESWTLTEKVTKQMPVSSFTKGFEAGAESVEVSLKVLLIITFLLNILAKGGLIYMLQMIRSLQIVLHFPLLRIIVPANVNMFFAYLIPIAMFDVLDPEWTTELVLNFDKTGQEDLSGDILDQMKDLGYETHNSVLNMGSLSIFLVAYFCKLGVYFTLLGVHRFLGRGKKIISFLESGLFYGDIISIVLDAYFEFIISGYLQIQEPLWTFNGESIAMLVGILALALALVWFPLISVWQLSKSEVECSSTAFKSKWGVLTEGISPSSRWKRAYFLIFIVRRLVFLFIAFGITKYLEFQIIGVLLLNVAYFLYIGLAMPHSFRLMNRIEMVNEFLIHLGTIALLLFTDWVPDQQMQYHAGGWSHIVLIAAMLFGNLYFVLASFLRSAKLAYLRLQMEIRKQQRRKLFGPRCDSAPTEKEESKPSPENMDSLENLDSIESHYLNFDLRRTPDITKRPEALADNDLTFSTPRELPPPVLGPILPLEKPESPPREVPVKVRSPALRRQVLVRKFSAVDGGVALKQQKKRKVIKKKVKKKKKA